MGTQAKFKVSRIELIMVNRMIKDENGSAKWVQQEARNIIMQVVVGDSNENDAFFASTPSGEITMRVVNQESAAQFELEKEYYVSFTPAG